MKILNATRNALSVMMDKGDLMTIEPGSFSGPFIATRNTILAAISLGTPSEIGITLGSTYEQNIAQQISGCQPYLYLSEEEAKARLIDPSIDYTTRLENNQLNDMRDELTEYKQMVDDLNAQIAEMDKVIASSKSDQSLETLQLKFDELQTKYDETKTENTKLNSELEGSKSNITELKNQIGTLEIEKKSLNDRIELLAKENQDLKTKEPEQINVEDSEQYRTLLDKNDQLVRSLDEATKRIESMRDLFNKACEKFNLQLTEEGEWIQLSENS